MATNQKILLLLFPFLPVLIMAQNLGKDPSSWMNSFASLSILETSDNGNWIITKKLTNTPNDSLLVFKVSEPKNPAYILVDKGSNPKFIDNNTLIAKGPKDSEVILLNKNKRWLIKDVNKSDYLSTSHSFYTFTKDSVFTLFNKEGEAYLSKEKISQIFHKEDKILIVQRRDKNCIYINPEKPLDNTYLSTKKTVYAATSQHHWLLVEEDTDNSLWIALLTNNGQVIKSTRLPSNAIPQTVTFVPSSNPNQFIIQLIYPQQAPNPSEIDIWSTEDPYLRYKVTGIPNYAFATWDISSNTLTTWDSSIDKHHILIPNKNFTISYSIKSFNKYYNPTQLFLFNVHDIHTHNEIPWTPHSSYIVTSKDSNYILALNEETNYWHLLSTKNQQNHIIQEKNWTKPIFSEDGKFIFFVDKNLIWRYNILTKTKAIALNIPNAELLTIQNATNRHFSNYSSIRMYSTYISKDQHLNVKYITNKTLQGVKSINQNLKITTLIPESPIRIIASRVIPQSSTIIALQEEFNKPAYIVKYSHDGKKSETLIQPFKDPEENLLRKEILYYNAEDGTELKALLFYPKNFDPQKKYPLITHVYEMQSIYAHKYLMPRYEFDGFSVRHLIENEYFVLLPDILIKSKSPAGEYAMKQLKAAIERVKSHPNIMYDKIGLHGHSFGGYQTNLAATKNFDFAAFISGSSISSIITKYYLYYKTLQLPEYARIENAQFALKVPLENNRELYNANDPLYNISKVKSPMLLWCGLNDLNTTPAETLAMFLGLLRNNKTAVALFYPNMDHSFPLNSPSSKDLTIKSLQWWDYFLKNRKDIPWINQQLKKEVN